MHEDHGTTAIQAARRAVMVAFAVHGLASSTWFVRIPDLRDRAGLSDGGLGLVLAALGLGAIVSMPIAGALTGRRGSSWTSIASLPLMALTLAVLGQAGAPVPLALGALAFGFALGLHDVGMNAHGVTVEREMRRPVLSGMHASYSLGVLGGAGIGAAATAVGVDPRVHLAAVGVVAIACLPLYRRMLPPSADREAQRHADAPRLTLGERLAPLRTGWLVACAAAAVSSFVAESAVSEWSGVLLRDHRGATPGVAALGVFVFSGAMTIGRLSGDRVISRFGDRRTLVASGGAAAVAWLIVVLVDHPVAALAAWAVAGFGLANAVPVLFRAAGTPRPAAPGRPQVSPAQGLSLVVGLGYAGGLLGPAAIGGVAALTGLPAALLIPALLSVSIVLLARAATGTPRRTAGAPAARFRCS